MRPATIPVQDAEREIALAALFGLARNNSRIGEDAQDDQGNHYELKTTTKPVVSTARDFGPRHIERWKRRFWLVAQGRNLPGGFVFESIYFLAPLHLASWYQRHLDQFARDDALRERVMACVGNLSWHERSATERMLRRGMLLNDPGIPWRYVQDHGIRIEQAFPQTLRALVAQFPLGREKPACAFFNFR